jgi:hypothetical protein
MSFARACCHGRRGSDGQADRLSDAHPCLCLSSSRQGSDPCFGTVITPRFAAGLPTCDSSGSCDVLSYKEDSSR